MWGTGWNDQEGEPNPLVVQSSPVQPTGFWQFVVFKQEYLVLESCVYSEIWSLYLVKIFILFIHSATSNILFCLPKFYSYESHFLVLQVTSCWHICWSIWLRDRRRPESSLCLPWLTPGAPSTWKTSTVRRVTTRIKLTSRASSPTSSSPALWLRDWKVCLDLDLNLDVKVFLFLLFIHCLAGTGVTTYSLHPGVVQTDLWRHLSGPQRVVMKMVSPFTKNSTQGAQTTIYCAVEPSLDKESGRYYRYAIQPPPFPSQSK